MTAAHRGVKYRGHQQLRVACEHSGERVEVHLLAVRLHLYVVQHACIAEITSFSMSIEGLEFAILRVLVFARRTPPPTLMWSSIPVQFGSDHFHQSNSSVDCHLSPFASVFLRSGMPARATQHKATPVESIPLEQGLWHQTCRMTCSIGRPAVASHPKPYLERRARCACFPAPASGNSAPLPSACAMRGHDVEHAGEAQPGAAECGTATMHDAELQVAELQMSN